MKALFILLILTSLYIGGCAVNSGVLSAKDSESFFDGAVYEGESNKLNEDTSGS